MTPAWLKQVLEHNSETITPEQLEQEHVQDDTEINYL